MLLAFVLVHAALSGATAYLTPRLGPRAFLLAALAPATGVALLASSARDVLTGHPWTQEITWVPGLDLSISLRLDALAWLMIVLISGVGLTIFVFSAGYARRDPTLTRFVATLTAFAGSMAALVLADDVLLLYVCWELTTITSFLLVGLRTDDSESRRAALQALLITTSGGLALLMGLLMLARQAGTSSISGIVEAAPHDTISQFGLALVLVGAVTKSAQAPFHIWLPSAMAAPTPVSAYLHAAAMVKAGVFLIARFAPAYADLPWWRPVLVAVGAATMLVGGWRALRQHDLKRLLAFSTVSQLGFLVVVAGWGSGPAVAALALVLLTHGFAKASLFMSLGAIDHVTGSRDLRRLDGLARRMPLLAGAATVAALSMAGVPVLLGFIAKEQVLEIFVYADGPSAQQVLAKVALAAVVAGSALTLGYALRFLWGAFGRKDRLADDDPDAMAALNRVDTSAVPAPGPLLAGPVLLLAAATLACGLVPSLLQPVVDAVIRQSGQPGEEHLALWHGLGAPLLFSIGITVAGAGLFLLRPVVWRGQAGLGRRFTGISADRLYSIALRGTDRVAAAVTGRSQVGSLPTYLGVIAVVAVMLPGLGLVLNPPPWPDLRWNDQIGQLPVAGTIAVAAVAACVVKARLTAVLLLGGVGYGIALLYVLHGAPDLALTQFLVETLSVVVFLFVLRLLPKRFPRQLHRGRTAGRVVVAAAVGVTATLLTLFAATPGRPTPAATPMLEQAYAEAHGRNVVNVILVDFRALDTLGEVTVVLVAGIGIALLVLTARRPEGNPVPEHPAHAPSLILGICVRIAFHPILAVSIFLLLSGHNNPGGGFIGGLVAGAVFVLRYLADRRPRASTPLPPVTVLGAGLLLAAGIAFAPLLDGGSVLTTSFWELPLPGLGSVGVSSVLVFDTGVYLVVTGLVLVILDSLGARRSTSLGIVNEDVRL